MEKTLILNRRLCAQILTVERCIPAMKNALIAVSDGKARMLGRTIIPHPNGNMLASMAASDLSRGVTGSKIIIFPGKETSIKGTSQGIIPLFSIEDGSLLAIIDADLITVVRTAATSAAATDALANKDADSIAILGCGKQGKAHVEAIISVRNIKKVFMWDMFPAASEAACLELKKKFPGVEFVNSQTSEQAVKEADIICTTTTGRSKDPIIKYEWLKAGVHINAIGACSAQGREIDSDTIYNALLFSDWNEAVKTDRGDFILASEKKKIQIPSVTEIGEVFSGKHPGRSDGGQVTLFESVGISVEDIAAANYIYEYAKENNLGQYVEI